MHGETLKSISIFYHNSSLVCALNRRTLQHHTSKLHVMEVWPHLEG